MFTLKRLSTLLKPQANFCFGRLKEFKTLIMGRNKTQNTENNVLVEVAQFRAPLPPAITKTYVCLQLCNVCWENNNLHIFTLPQSSLPEKSPHHNTGH